MKRDIGNSWLDADWQCGHDTDSTTLHSTAAWVHITCPHVKKKQFIHQGQQYTISFKRDETNDWSDPSIYATNEKIWQWIKKCSIHQGRGWGRGRRKRRRRRGYLFAGEEGFVYGPLIAAFFCSFNTLPETSKKQHMIMLVIDEARDQFKSKEGSE